MENVQISKENADVVIKALSELIEYKNNTIDSLNRSIARLEEFISNNDCRFLQADVRENLTLLSYKYILEDDVNKVAKYKEIIEQLSGGVNNGSNNIK